VTVDLLDYDIAAGMQTAELEFCLGGFCGKAHPFFDGIDWEGIRQQTAPSFIPPTEPNPSDLEQDWELQSMRAKMQGNLNISAQPRQNVVYRAANECESP
jgi:hypothetical protein